MDIERREWLWAGCLLAALPCCWGCESKPAPTKVDATPVVHAAPESEPAEPVVLTYDRQAEVILSTRDKEKKLLVAIDFANSKAMDKTLPFAERRQYVTEQALEHYMKDFAKSEKPGQRIKLLAMSVPNRDDYLRGDFRNLEELAVFDTTQDNLIDTTKSSDERLGEIEWRSVLK